mgnify:CR=1 FL=1
MLLFPGDVEVGSVAEGRAFSHWLQGLPIKGPRVITWGNMGKRLSEALMVYCSGAVVWVLWQWLVGGGEALSGGEMKG